MISTSYFASKAPADKKVCIALKRPRFLKKGALWVKDLAPSDPFSANWEESYLNDLNTRFPGGSGLAELLAEIESKVLDPVLCCYEKDRNTCHRSILSDFIEKNLGVLVKEW